MSSAVADMWEPTGEPPPAALAAARIELHWASQAAAAAAHILVPALPDHSHTSLGWEPARRLLVGWPTPSGRRVAVRPADLAIAVIGAAGAVVAELPLAGRTLEEALAWLAPALAAPAGTVLPPPPYELPPLAGNGQKFDGGARPAYAELARWYATADAALTAVARSTPGASAVRCWPHHFDIATLLPRPAAAGSGGAPARTVGVGLSPGDESYAQPYWYVTPWPYPSAPALLPPLPSGAGWHREGWFGAVMTATDALRPAAAIDRARGVSDFIAAALRGVSSL